MRIVRGFDPVVYVLKCEEDLPAEQQTRFTVRPLTFGEREHVRDKLPKAANGEDGGTVSFTRHVLNVGLLDWAKLQGEGGSFEPFPPVASGPGRQLPEHVFDLLGDYAHEIAHHIWGLSCLSRDEQKKS